MESNLNVKSNLMIDDANHIPEYKYLPGDYIGIIYPQYIAPSIRENFLTREQNIELDQYLVCHLCGKMCAGNCDKRA